MLESLSPLTVYSLMENGIDDVIVHAAVTVYRGQGWVSKEAKHL